MVQSAWPPWSLELRATDLGRQGSELHWPAIPPPSQRQGGGESPPTAKGAELGDLVSGEVWSSFYDPMITMVGLNGISTQRENALVCLLRKIQILFFIFKE